MSLSVLTSIVPDGLWVLPGEQVERLRREFPALTFVDAPGREERLRELPAADVAFLSQLRPAELAMASRLRWIQSPAAGVGSLLFAELRDGPVVVTNARGIHGEAIAEHVLAVTIGLFRRLDHAMRAQVAHRWTKDELPLASYRTVGGRRMGIVGLGAVGAAIARKAAALGMHVIAVRRRVDASKPACVEEVYAPEELGVLLERSDVVVLAAPLTESTRGLIGRAELQRMRPDAILVNIARGKLVREDELASALASGTIGGAALDVFEHEPLGPASPLWDLPNVLITPHSSAFRADYWDAAVSLFVENLRRFVKGEPLVNVVDKKAGY